MLVLTRKTNQSIMIGDDDRGLRARGFRDKIRLGITAPRDVPVFRKEVYLSIKGEAAEARAATGDSNGEADGRSTRRSTSWRRPASRAIR